LFGKTLRAGARSVANLKTELLSLGMVMVVMLPAGNRSGAHRPRKGFMQQKAAAPG